MLRVGMAEPSGKFVREYYGMAGKDLGRGFCKLPGFARLDSPFDSAQGRLVGAVPTYNPLTCIYESATMYIFGKRGPYGRNHDINPPGHGLG